MFKLLRDNIVREVSTEEEKLSLLERGFKLVSDGAVVEESAATEEPAEDDAQESSEETPKNGKGGKKNAK